MSTEPKKQSAYSDYLYNMVDKWFEEGRAGFTVYEIASFANLKVTGNLRRRINHCVASGKLNVTTAYYGKYAKCLVYYLPGHFGVESYS